MACSLMTSIVVGIIVAFPIAVVDANAFLRARPSMREERMSQEDVQTSLLAEVEGTFGEGSASSRVKQIEMHLAEMYAALPKNEKGYLGHATVRYALHRLFVQRHGWSIKGLDVAGGHRNSTTNAGLLKEHVPAYLQDLFEQRLGGRGFGLHELSVLAATIEHLVQSEAIKRLGDAFKVVGGGDKGGILVRSGKALASSQEPERLSTGALIKELALEGERLQFERLSGTGPTTGWVSLKLKDKDLVVRTDKVTGEEGLESAPATEANKYRLRWAVNIDEWMPVGDADGAEFQFLLTLIEPEAERNQVMKYKLWPDRKRALVSRLLMRAASACVMDRTNFKGIDVKRTKGRKPFLSSPLPPEAEAPNWNANPSHEGSWVVCASEPFCVCGIDVAELRLTLKNGQTVDFYKTFQAQLTDVEWRDVKNSGGSLEDQYEVFSRYWAAKEAFTKARGDGMGYEFSKCEFHWTPLPGFPPKTAYQGTVKVEGKPAPLWRLVQHKLPSAQPHWVTVARGPLTDIVDAQGEFTRTLRKKQDAFSPAEWRNELNADSPNFDILPFAALVPPDEIENYEKVKKS